MYHTFFIHSAVREHLGGFRVLAIVNSEAMNIGMHVSLSYSIVWVYAQELAASAILIQGLPESASLFLLT